MKRKSRKVNKKKLPATKLHVAVVIMVILSCLFATLFFVGEPKYTQLATKVASQAQIDPPPAHTWNFLLSIPVCAVVGGLVAFASSCWEWTNAAQALILAIFNLVFLGLLGLVVSQVVVNYASYTHARAICKSTEGMTSDCSQLKIYFKILLTGAAALVLSELLLLVLSWARSSQILRKRNSDLPLNKIVSDALQMRPQRNVIFLGRSGSGKTHTLYRLKWSEEIINAESKYQRKLIPSSNLTVDKTEAAIGDEYELKTKLAQMGFNNEIIKFHHLSDLGERRKIYEFWDVSGSDRFMWRAFYIRILFDIVVYTIDASEFRAYNKTKGLDDDDFKEEKGDFEEDDDTPFVNDRMELLALLNEPHLQHAQFLVFLNFKKDDDLTHSDKVTVHAIKDFLDLHEYSVNPPRLATSGPKEYRGYAPRRRLQWVDNSNVLKSELVRLFDRTKTPTS